ncbi:protein PLASTID MOVEMENT IMPAIRED 1-RELATED 2-like [Ananas comosus]|uniref:Protein PLASTID MOVEMENT IMPAIRED 1-RELATED 2-like n=1 Tax=Ananas comosus TaxID=4615 RepID=A0A6P5FLN8_ANACO|nr:protein PLASTID MOVEMENT IMPAIRED 1-RELATED 2-like [Ananas comosus]
MSERSLSAMGGDADDDDAGDGRFLRDIQTLSRALSLVPGRSSGDVACPRPKPSSSKKPSPWRRSLKALSHIDQRRLECVFSLRVHSVDGLPAALHGAALAVRWRRASSAADDAGATRPVRLVGGAAEFEETLTHRCSVYYTRGGGPRLRAVHYEPRPFAIRAAVVGSPEVDLGRHRVDLARLLPLTAEEMAEEEKAAGRWSTSLRLSGAARGAMLDVSLGFSILKDGAAATANPIAEKKISEVLYEKAGGSNWPGQMNDSIGSNDQRHSTDNVKKVLHEIPRSSKSGAPLEPEDENSCGGSSDHEAQSQLGEVAKLKSRHYTLSELLKGCSEEDGCDETKYTVIEQGVEVSSTDRIGGSSTADQVVEEDQMAKETESAFVAFSVRGSEDTLESPKIEENLTDPQSYVGRRSNRDSAILRMLGIDESSSELSSDSDPDSPREQLWKQFKKEVLASSNSSLRRDFGEETVIGQRTGKDLNHK